MQGDVHKSFQVLDESDLSNYYSISLLTYTILDVLIQVQDSQLLSMLSGKSRDPDPSHGRPQPTQTDKSRWQPTKSTHSVQVWPTKKTELVRTEVKTTLLASVSF